MARCNRVASVDVSGHLKEEEDRVKGFNGDIWHLKLLCRACDMRILLAGSMEAIIVGKRMGERESTRDEKTLQVETKLRNERIKAGLYRVNLAKCPLLHPIITTRTIR